LVLFVKGRYEGMRKWVSKNHEKEKGMCFFFDRKRNLLLKASCGKILGHLRKKREKYIISLNEQTVDFQIV
jgi:hypothetical protein